MISTPSPVRVAALLAALAAVGCASQPAKAPDPGRPQEKPTEAGSTAPTPSPERPVKAKADDDFIFPPAPAEGLTAASVPVIVSEPVVLGQPAPLLPEHESIVAFDVPKPAKRRPKGRGFPAPKPVTGPAVAPPSRETAPVGIGGEPPAPRSPALTTTFDSLVFDDNGANTGSLFIPPDARGAAGPNHVVSVVNSSLQFHTKAGTPLLDSVAGVPVTGVSLASLFGPLGPLTETFDPKVLYDQVANRWLIVTLEQTDTFVGDPADTSRIFVAVSDDSDPLGSYTIIAINSAITISGTPSWADYPGFAVDEEAVYITANMFGFFNFGAPYGGVRLWIIDKGLGAGGFYDGGATLVTVTDPYAGAGIATTTQPAHVFCSPGSTCPVTAGTYLVSYSGLSGGGVEFLQVVRVDNPVTAPAFTQQFVSLGDIEALVAPLPPAPQMGSTFAIATNDRRALDAVWRDDGSLWMTATIDPNPATSAVDAGEATAAWWQLATGSPDPSFAALVQQGLISGDTDIAADAHTFFPSIAVNNVNGVTIGFSASAPTIFPGSYYTTRAADDALGSTTASGTLRVGLDTYERTFDDGGSDGICDEPDSRWGDYSGAVVDPADQCYWVYNQHAIARGTPLSGVCGDLAPPGSEDGRWGTAFGKLCVVCETSPLTISTPTTGNLTRRAQTIIVNGMGDVTASGNLSLKGQTITIEDGFTVEGLLSVFTGFCPL